ncbi:helix-turn-helix domain-containing protein [Nocardia sp. NPDC052001]|uniref:winged helix-turn-helix transcriptional regulator n=1 Tax=Nocardia sp. NPDC052001 TaxID=3154853 RepID=UPI003412C300
MLGKTYDTQICSIARTLEVIGERWTLLIVRDALFAGATRYGDFQRNLGIATNILKTRLDTLVETGIMLRRTASEHPTQYEYLLTDKGRALAPALIALTAWGDEWATEGEPPILYTHSTCGSAIAHRTVCAHCGDVNDPAQVHATFGPGMPAERIAESMARSSGAGPALRS